MNKTNDRFQTWSDAAFTAWRNGDSDAHLSLWAEDATHLAINPFDESEPLRGRSAIVKDFDGWSAIEGKQLLKNEILSSGTEHGIGNARASWKGKDGKTWACDWIYLVNLDSNDMCTSYQEWNVVRSRED